MKKVESKPMLVLDKNATKVIFKKFEKCKNQFIPSNPKRYYERVELDMEFAEACKTNNVGNRKSNKQMREKIANAIRSKNGWIYNGATIVITKSGRLIDGQNRILAYIDAGCPKGILTDVVIVEDVDVEVRDTLGICIPYTNYQFTVDNGFDELIAKRVETVSTSLMYMLTRPHDSRINKLHSQCLKDTENLYRKELNEFCSSTNKRGLYNPTAAAIIFIGKAAGIGDEVMAVLQEASKVALSSEASENASHIAAVLGDWTRGYRLLHSSKGKVLGGNGTYDTQVKMAVGIMAGIAILEKNSNFRLSTDGKYQNNLGELLNKARSIASKYGNQVFATEALNALAMDKRGE